MKLETLHSTLLAAVVLALASPHSVAAENKADAKAAPQTEAELIAKARASYPLKTCLVSNEDLGSLAEAVAYVHRSAGQSDRVIFLCCEGCIDDFKGDPSKFLKKVDAAAQPKPGSEKKKKSKS